MSSLASSLNPLGNDSVGYAINSVGDVAGSLQNFANGRRGFRMLSGGAAQLLNPLAGHTGSEAFAMNLAGQAVGYSTKCLGRTCRALEQRTQCYLARHITGHFSSRALAINESGLIVRLSTSNNANGVRRGFLQQGATMMDLGLLPGGSSSEAHGINAFGQIVGTATRAGSASAWLRSAGVNYDLNDLIYDSRTFALANSNWKLEMARSISRNGTVVGTGKRNGSDRAFLALPAWVIGKQITRPEGAVERQPEIEILSGDPQDTGQNAFFWSTFEKRLYAIRPITARLKWFTSFSDTTGTGTNIQANTERIEAVGISVWPKEPTIHVATAAVQVEPTSVPFNYGFQNIIYDTTTGSARVDPTAKIFTCEHTGYSVLYYLQTFGAQPAPNSQRPFFDVVRTVIWNDPTHLKERAAVVGQKLTYPAGCSHGRPWPSGLSEQERFRLLRKVFLRRCGRRSRPRPRHSPGGDHPRESRYRRARQRHGRRVVSLKSYWRGLGRPARALQCVLAERQRCGQHCHRQHAQLRATLATTPAHASIINRTQRCPAITRTRSTRSSPRPRTARVQRFLLCATISTRSSRRRLPNPTRF